MRRVSLLQRQKDVNVVNLNQNIQTFTHNCLDLSPLCTGFIQLIQKMLTEEELNSNWRTRFDELVLSLQAKEDNFD